MIHVMHGDLLHCQAEALVNTVNTQGVMGKGLALQFKRAFPHVNVEYELACKARQVKVGRMHVVDLSFWSTGLWSGGPRWIINFPTKGQWRAKSKLEDIESGLVDLVATVCTLGIMTIAVPGLGCGLGGLSWSEVRPRIEAAFKPLSDVLVLLFEPGK